MPYDNVPAERSSKTPLLVNAVLTGLVVIGIGAQFGVEGVVYLLSTILLFIVCFGLHFRLKIRKILGQRSRVSPYFP